MAGFLARGRSVALGVVAVLALGVAVPFSAVGMADDAAADSSYTAEYTIGCGPNRTAELVAAFKEITGGNMPSGNAFHGSYLLGSPKSFHVSLAPGCVYEFSASYDGQNALPAVGGDLLNEKASYYGIEEHIVLDGNGATFKRTGGAPFRFLSVRNSQASLTVNDLTLIGGQAPDGTHEPAEWWWYAANLAMQVITTAATMGSSTVFAAAVTTYSRIKTLMKVAGVVGKYISGTTSDAEMGPVTPGRPGGAISSDGNLILNRTVFQSNRAGDGGNGADADGQDGAGGGSGGAVFIGVTGSLIASDSTFSGNRAGAGGVGSYGASGLVGGGGDGGDGGDGGAIASYGPTLIQGSVFTQNQVGLPGGPGKDWGVWQSSGDYGIGGAVLLGGTDGTPSTVDSSSFVENGTRAGGLGGAIATGMTVQAEVSNSTFARNAAGTGGALVASTYYAMTDPEWGSPTFGQWINNGNSIDVRNSVFIGNSANDGRSVHAGAGNSVQLRNSVIVGGGIGASECERSGTWQGYGAGQIGTAGLVLDTGDPDCQGTIAAAEQLALGPLAASETPAGVLGVVPGEASVLRDAGDPAYCPDYDARGLPRNAATRGTCDVGTIDHFEWPATSLGTLYQGDYQTGASDAAASWPWNWPDPSSWFISNGYLDPYGGEEFQTVLDGPGHVYFYLPPKIEVENVHYVLKVLQRGGATELRLDHDGEAITDFFRVPVVFTDYGPTDVELWVETAFGDRIKLDSQSFDVVNADNHAPVLSFSPDYSGLQYVDHYTTQHFVVTVSDADPDSSWTFSQTPSCGSNATLRNLRTLADRFEFDCDFGAGSSGPSYPRSRVSAQVIDDQGAKNAVVQFPDPQIRYQPARLYSGWSEERTIPVGGSQTFHYELRGDPIDLAARAAEPASIGEQVCGSYLTGPTQQQATASGGALLGSFVCTATDAIGKGVGSIAHGSYEAGALGVYGTTFRFDGSERHTSRYQIIAPVTITAPSRVYAVDGPPLSVTLGALNHPDPATVGSTYIDWGDGSGPQWLSAGWVPGTYGHVYAAAGEHEVQVIARVSDGAEETDVVVWTTTVVDTEAARPVLDGLPGTITLSNASADAATLHYLVTASDPFQGTRELACSIADGAVLPIGTVTVDCSASSGQPYPAGSAPTTSGSFEVVVRDVLAPVLGTPTVQQTVVDGATTVDFSILVEDDDPAAQIACTPSSGSVFLAGVTTVSCTASDTAENTASLTFLVNVGEGAPPQIVVPEQVTASSANGAGVVVEYAVTASDQLGAPVTPSCFPPSGGRFAPGTTTVSCSATDGNGNWSTASFPVVVYGGTVTDAVTLASQFERGGQTTGGIRTNAVKLGADIAIEAASDGTGHALRLAPGDVVTLDLAGHALAVEGPKGSAAIEVPPGATLTVIDSSSGRTGELSVRAQGGGAAIGGSVCRSAGTIVIGPGVHGTALSIGGDGIGGGAAIGAGTSLTPAVIAHFGLNPSAVSCDASLSGGTLRLTGIAYGEGSPSAAGSRAGGTTTAPGAAIGWTAPAAGQPREAVWAILPEDTGADQGIGFGPSGWLTVHLGGGTASDELGGPLAVPEQLVFTRFSLNPGDLPPAADEAENPGVADPVRSGYFFGGWRDASGEAWGYDRSTAASDFASGQDVDVVASWIPMTGDGDARQLQVPAGADALLDLRGARLSVNADPLAYDDPGPHPGPGIALPPTATLTIADTTGSGGITVHGGDGAAGIGGGAGEGAGTLVVRGGDVRASGFGGAGIGGGSGGSGGTVELHGGDLTALSYPGTVGGESVAAAAAVGAGHAGASGGTVTAYGSEYLDPRWEPDWGPSMPSDGGGPGAAAYTAAPGPQWLTGASLAADGEEPSVFSASFGYPVVFHLDGGLLPAGALPWDIADGDSMLNGPRGGLLQYVPEASPEKDGAVFAGWYLDAARTLPVDFGTLVLAGETDLYARWSDPATRLVPDGEPGVGPYPVRIGGTLSATLPTSWNGGAIVLGTGAPPAEPEALPEDADAGAVAAYQAAYADYLELLAEHQADPYGTGVGLQVHYEWLRGGVPIRDAPDAATYAPKLADLGKAVTVRITASADGLEPWTWTSPASGGVVAGEYIPSSFDRVGFDAPQIGDTLAIEGLSWGAWDGDVGTSPVSPSAVNYTWLRGTTVSGGDLVDGVPIAGAANAPSYTVGAADVGHRIALVITAAGDGFAPYTLSNSLSGPVVARVFAPASAPTITTSCAPVVNNCWLYAATGTWEPAAGRAFSYQWFAGTPGGEVLPLAGRTSSSLNTANVPTGQTVWLEVTATAPGYESVTLRSADGVYVDGGHFIVGAAGIPVITKQNGAPIGGSTDLVPGKRIEADWDFDAWSPIIYPSFQWFASDTEGDLGSPINAPTTSSQLVIPAGLSGKYLRVRLTGAMAGYHTEVRTSTAIQLPEAVTVRFDANGGTPVEDGSTLIGTRIARPADPSREGYAFAGWYSELLYGGGLFDFDQLITTDDRVATARWTVNALPLPAGPIDLGSIPIPSGTALAGLFQDPELTIPVDVSAPLGAPVSLYPAWVPTTVADWPGLVAAFGAIAPIERKVTLAVDGDWTQTADLAVPDGSTVHLDLAGQWLYASGLEDGRAGLRVPPGAALIVEDSVGGGLLNASPYGAAAGIGGDAGESAGAIAIRGAAVTAFGDDGASIGAGAGASGGGTLEIAGNALGGLPLLTAAPGTAAAAISVGGTPVGPYADFSASALDYGLYGPFSRVDIAYGHAVHLELDGGVLAEGYLADAAVPTDGWHYLDPAPVSEGYGFSGWFADAERTVPLGTHSDGHGGTVVDVTGDLTAYAAWTPLPPVAIVVATGGDCGVAVDRPAAFGDLVCAVSAGGVIDSQWTPDGTAWFLDGQPVVFQWLLDGLPVDSTVDAGPHAPSFRIAGGAIGRELSVRMTVSAPDAPPLEATSDAAPIAAVVASTTPTISGTPEPGATLTADPGTWTTAADRFAYTWLRDGDPVGAVDVVGGDEYAVGAADAGAEISVRVKWIKESSFFSALNTTATATSASAHVPEPAAVAPSIGASSVPAGTVGVFYAQDLGLTGSPSPSLEVTAGALPPGLGLTETSIYG
ncbi:MAG: InlB B-repeat-containing protein, partial [Microbacteriaceae bacterium]|nr:InlB B-repeat-containing protein [Microbacteriaceae bacterium]